jgi:CRP-like cAMP-binding protein
MRRVQFQAGDRVFAQGDPSDGAYMVIVGAIAISADSDGKAYALGEVGPGCLFGEMGLIDNAPRSATAVAKVDTTCAAYDPDELSRLMLDNPEELLRITRTLIQRLRDADRKYVDLLTLSRQGQSS